MHHIEKAVSVSKSMIGLMGMVEFYPFLLDYFRCKKSFKVILTFKTKGSARDEWSGKNTHHIGAIGLGSHNVVMGVLFFFTGAGMCMH